MLKNWKKINRLVQRPIQLCVTGKAKGPLKKTKATTLSIFRSLPRQVYIIVENDCEYTFTDYI